MHDLFCRCWLPVLLAVGAAVPVSSADQDVAYVLQVSGPWAVSRARSQDLHPGQGLQPGDTIALRRPAKASDLLVLLGRNNQIVAQRRCAVDDCGSPISIPESLGASESLSARVLRAVMEKWTREGSSRFSRMESRGGTDILYEGVIAVGSAETELLPVVGDLSPGSYTLVWEPVAVEGREVPVAPPSTPVEVGPGRPARLGQMSLPPGLYSVQAFRGASTDASGAVPIADAWVLAVACSYQEIAGLFDEAVGVSAAWADEVSGSTVRRFLRARLFDLASTLPPCPG